MALSYFPPRCHSLARQTAWGEVYEAIHETFDWLPLAALVGDKMLVLHGGIGDGSWGLKELYDVQRPLRDEYGSTVSLHEQSAQAQT